MTEKASRTAVIAGATGLVGKQLVQILLNHPAYRQVTVFVRRDLGITHPKLVQKVISFDRLEEALDAATMKHADVFCTLGTTIKTAGSQEAFRKVDYTYPLALGSQAKKHGATAFVIVTAMGSSVHSKFFYSRVKGELERDLIALDLPKIVIIKPSLLLGDRTEQRFGERAGTVLFQLFRPLMVGPMARYRAVHGKDVASAMVSSACQGQDTPKLQIIESDEIVKLSL